MASSAHSPVVKFLWLLKAVTSHYWRHPWQTLFLLLGLSAGVGLWSAVQIVNQQAEDSYREADFLLGAQASYWIRSKSDSGVSQAQYIQLRRAGWRQVFPLVEGEVSTAAGQPLTIIATDLFALPSKLLDQGGFEVGAVTAEEWLQFTQPPWRSWVPEQLARELNLQPGEALVLRDGRLLPPALIQSHEQQGRQVLMDVGAAFALLNTQRFSSLAVGSIDPLQARALAALLDPDLQLVENLQQLDLTELTSSLHTHLTAMSLLSFAVGLFIVFNAVRFSLWYRRETLFNLRLMGVSVAQLSLAILLETLAWSVIGAGVGVALGLVLAQGLLPGLSASLHSLYGANLDAFIDLQAQTLLKAWLITLLGLLWALAWPLYLQLRQSVMVTSQPGSSHQQEASARYRLALASLALLLVAGLLYSSLDSVIGGFVLLGLLLFAAAWVLPLLLAAGLGLVARLLPERRLIARWLVSDGWSQMPAFRSAMMALLLALTANLGVGTLIDSFRSAFTGWLDVRQSADIYLRSPQVNLERLLDPDSASDWLLDSHTRVGVTTRWRGRPTLLRGADTRAPDSLAFPLAQWLGDSPQQALARWRDEPGAILANEQLHYLGGLQLGETLQLQSDDGARDYHVVGFFYDYGNAYFQFYLPYAELKAHWKQVYGSGTALWLKPDSGVGPGSVARAEAALRAAGAKPGDWILQREIRQLSVNIFDRTFAITSAMNGLTLIVAAVALLASLLAILQERLPQFAQWRALGLRQREQLLVIACPMLIFVSVTWLLAIPLGALLSWLLINKLNIVSFGWSMPMLWTSAPAWWLGLLLLVALALTLLVVFLQLRLRLPRALAELGEMA